MSRFLQDGFHRIYTLQAVLAIMSFGILSMGFQSGSALEYGIGIAATIVAMVVPHIFYRAAVKALEERASTKKLNDEIAESLANPPVRQIYVPDPADPRIVSWLQKLKQEIMKNGPKDPMGEDEPYYGACGGGLTYEITPTSLGTVVVVRETVTGKGLNLTDYDAW